MIDLAQKYKGIVFYNPAECRVLMDMKTVELIKKDLEVLDIIKKWLIERIADYRDYDNTLFVDTFIRDYEPIFKILGEWLNEE